MGTVPVTKVSQQTIKLVIFIVTISCHQSMGTAQQCNEQGHFHVTVVYSNKRRCKHACRRGRKELHKLGALLRKGVLRTKSKRVWLKEQVCGKKEASHCQIGRCIQKHQYRLEYDRAHH